MEKNTIEDESGLTFHINTSDHTASVSITSKASSKVFIPRIIKYDSQEYPIKAISSCSNTKNLVTIDFPEDSEVQTFENGSLAFSKITTLFIPASVKELKKGWCNSTYILNKVIISANNNNFANFGRDIIIGKSNPQSNLFDTIYFASRKINQVIIPSYIKKINPYSFSDCDSLGYVEFPENSELEVIDDNSFLHSNISYISIPKSTKIIGKEAFNNCSKK